MASPSALNNIQAKIWDGRLPLEIRLAPSECRTFDQSDPFLISVPRLSYLPLLLPRLHAFFSQSLIADPSSVSPHDGFFTYDSVPLKWHLPLGLLYDIYALSLQDANSDAPSTKKPLPFKIMLHFSTSTSVTNDQRANLISPTPLVLHDSFINSVKEADFLRSGTAKPIMSLSAADSKALWSSTQAIDLQTFAKIHSSLLPPPGQFRNIPIRVYIPSSSQNQATLEDATTQPPIQAQIKVLQSHVSPFISASQTSNPPSRTPTTQTPQTLGTALHNMLPRLFPSRRTPILARPLLHGGHVPMNANLEELARYACYADGWLGIVVVMNS